MWSELGLLIVDLCMYKAHYCLNRLKLILMLAKTKCNKEGKPLAPLLLKCILKQTSSCTL